MPVMWNTQELKEDELVCPVCGNVMEFDGDGCCPHTLFVHARTEDDEPHFLYQQPQFKTVYLETLKNSNAVDGSASTGDDLHEEVLPTIFKNTEAVVETYTDAGSPYPATKIVVAYARKKQFNIL